MKVLYLAFLVTGLRWFNLTFISAPGFDCGSSELGISSEIVNTTVAQQAIRFYSTVGVYPSKQLFLLCQSYSSRPRRSVLWILLLASGDIESNPGPRMPKYPCGYCNKAVKTTDKAVCCDQCNKWIHNCCSGLSDQAYVQLQHSTCNWICPNCGIPNFSDSFFDTSLDQSPNRFSLLSQMGANRTLNITSYVNPTDVSEHGSNRSKASKSTRKHNKPIKVVSLNANGIISKKLDIELIIHDHKPDIICCQETHLNSSIKSSELFNNSYTVYRKDRDCRGGGVCIAVSNDILASPCPELDTDTESVWIKIQVAGHKLLHICSFYRPPSEKGEYIDRLRPALETLSKKYCKKDLPHVVVCGDFNFPQIDWESLLPVSNCSGNLLLELANDFNLSQLVQSPTRKDVNSGAENILDLVFSTHRSLISNLLVGEQISDHSMIGFNVNSNLKVAVKSPRKIYIYSKGNYQAMKEEFNLFSSNYRHNANNASVEENWCAFKSKILMLANKHIPNKVVSDSNRPAWLNRQVKHLMNIRNRLAKKVKHNNSTDAINKLRQARKNVKNAIKESHNNYVKSIIGGNNKNLSRFYKYINSKRTDGNYIPPINSINNNDQLTGNADKANEFNKFFSSVFTDEPSDNTPELEMNATVSSMPDINVTENGVYNLLVGLDPNKASGPDGIAPRILIELASEISPVLTHLFNQSLQTGQVPTDWRQANVTPIFKKGSRDKVQNYRPVSLTSISCKILEHILYSNIINHLEKSNLLCHQQHGFRKGHSCETQLIGAFNDWATVLNKKSQTDVAVLDFSKAFDVVPHKRLASKLFAYGVRGNTLNWISQFLSNRQQRVHINSACSNWAPVLSGVPQGTVLGPLLFLIYINDIVRNIDCTIRLFADDCIVYKEINSITDCKVLQNDLNKLQDWQQTWLMKFNVEKCNVIRITNRKSNKIIHRYSMNGNVLSETNTCTYLGITIEANLKWHAHSANAIHKANNVLGLLRRNIGSCSSETKTLAYNTLVRPCLEYATAAWDPHLKTHIDGIEMVQRRAARFVKSDYRRTTSVSAILRDLKWPTLESRRTLNRLKILHNSINGVLAVPTTDLRISNRTTRYNTGSSKVFTAISTSSDAYKYSFFPRTIKDWNGLDDDTRNLPTIGSFCSAAGKTVFKYY